MTAVRAVNLAAFGTPLEADLVDALRDDAMTALVLDDSVPVPMGTITYPAPSGT